MEQTTEVFLKLDFDLRSKEATNWYLQGSYATDHMMIMKASNSHLWVVTDWMPQK